MRRAAYRVLLALHPPAFRRQFGGEMLWVFDEADRDRQASGFCMDVSGSLLRHWLRQPMLWSIAGAAAVSALMLMWMSAVSPPGRTHRSAAIEMDYLMVFAVVSLMAIALTLITTAALLHSIRRRRL